MVRMKWELFCERRAAMKKYVSIIVFALIAMTFTTFCFAGDDPPAPQDPKATVSTVEIQE